MKRYFIKPRMERLDGFEIDPENYLARTVYEQDDTPFATGVLDRDGNMIMAAVCMDQIGFVRTDG